LNPKLINRLVVVRNIALVLLLFFGLRSENADAQRYGTLLGLMVVYVIWIRFREFPFMQNKVINYASYFGDVVFIALINYHSLLHPNYFFLLLYYLAILSTGAYLDAVRALVVNIFTLAALGYRLAELAGQTHTAAQPLVLGLTAAVLVAVAYLARQRSLG